ncbi:MAG TPA: hypothetical protein VMH02_05745 [Verrucomicrobiae bacterium]|nr:hypothetical protein [Verrucomicrobiae bacterium]
MDVTLVAYEKYPALAPDDVVFREALERCGASVRVAVWSDRGVDWSRSPVTVLRETWDYPQRYDEFLSWLGAVESQTRVINDPALVRWNVDKRYLADLERAGIAIVPTAFVEPSEARDAAELCAARNWDDVVMKPSVGGSSFLAARFRGAAIASDGRRHLRSLLQRGAALIQPYQAQVETQGERALIAIGGALTHAVSKATFNSATETTSERLHEPTAAETAFAHRALAALPAPPAYARIDLIPSSAGPLLLELEVVEPSLYFAFEPSSAQRLARAVLG